MRYEIQHTRRTGSFVINSDDIERLVPVENRSVDVTLAYHPLYHRYIDEVLFRETEKGKHLCVSLDGSQVAQVVNDDREQQSAYCDGDGSDNCYDYGKSHAVPKPCTRCLLLSACNRARLGDYRKVRPAPIEYRASPGMTMALILMIGSLLLVCNLWARTKTDMDKDGCAKLIYATKRQ